MTYEIDYITTPDENGNTTVYLKRTGRSLVDRMRKIEADYRTRKSSDLNLCVDRERMKMLVKEYHLH